jgi:hypothetical protein
LKTERVDFADVPWSELDAFGDRVFSQRRGWVAFLCDTQGGEAVVARIHDGTGTLGWFTGVKFRRLGVPILGSPFPGWTTPYGGFNLREGVPRAEALRAVVQLAFGKLGCLHFEVADPYLRREDAEPLGFRAQLGMSFESDLRLSEEELFARMDGGCRRCIRKAEKSGVIVEEASGDGFAAEYYTHLLDVFAKQNMRPSYSQARVESLIRHAHPSGDLLLLRARAPNGTSIATGIFPGYNRISYFFGNGSLREHQILRPNEALHWAAMRYWKRRGVTIHNWGGGGAYKEKYGGQKVETLHFRLPRYLVVGSIRDYVRSVYYFPRRIKRAIFLRRIERKR